MLKITVKYVKRYKRPGLKPVVGFSLTKDFNQAVSMDLKTYD